MTVLGCELLGACSLLLWYRLPLAHHCLAGVRLGCPTTSPIPDTEGWGRSVGEGRQAQTSLLCLKFPGAHLLRWLEAAGG